MHEIFVLENYIFPFFMYILHFSRETFQGLVLCELKMFAHETSTMSYARSYRMGIGDFNSAPANFENISNILNRNEKCTSLGKPCVF